MVYFPLTQVQQGFHCSPGQLSSLQWLDDLVTSILQFCYLCMWFPSHRSLIASKRKWHISAHSLLVRRSHTASLQLRGRLGNSGDHMEYLMSSTISSVYTDGRNTSRQLRSWQWDTGLAGGSTEKPLSEGCDLKPGDSCFYILYMPELHHHQSNLLSGWDWIFEMENQHGSHG